MTIIETPATSGDNLVPQAEKVRRDRAPRLALSSPFLHKMQRRHFVLYDILPFLGAVATVAWAIRVPPTAVDIGLFFLFWWLTGLGLTIGFHRLFCHRAFKAGPVLRVLLTICGCMAARSSMITWTAQHRRHHQIADHAGDVHSPNLHGDDWIGRCRGWLYSHITWMWKHEYPNVAHYVPDLLADRLVMKADRYYQLWIIVGLLLPALLGGLLTQTWIGAVTGFLWGGVVRLFVVAQQISAINSFNHLLGTRPFKMRDNRSHNNALFGVFTWGEGWHNNHHAFPYSANFGYRWYHLDPGYLVIRAMECLCLVQEVRRPDYHKVEQLRQRLLNDKCLNDESASTPAWDDSVASKKY